jgi:hypothetical protein
MDLRPMMSDWPRRVSGTQMVAAEQSHPTGASAPSRGGHTERSQHLLWSPMDALTPSSSDPCEHARNGQSELSGEPMRRPRSETHIRARIEQSTERHCAKPATQNRTNAAMARLQEDGAGGAAVERNACRVRVRRRIDQLLFAGQQQPRQQPRTPSINGLELVRKLLDPSVLTLI